MPWEQLSDKFTAFSNECDVLVVYEHEKDDEVNRTHCHALVEVANEERIRQVVSECNRENNTGLKGNSLYMLSTEYSTKKRSKKVKVNDGLITYMTKGILEPKYTKGFTDERINQLRGEWKTYRNDIPIEVKNDVIMPIKCGECESIKRVTDYQILGEVLYDIRNKGIDSFTPSSYPIICKSVIDVRKKYHKMTPQVKLQEYIFMIMNTDFETFETNISKVSMKKIASYLGFVHYDG